MAYGRSNSKNGWALFFLILAGIVLGGFLGSLAEGSKIFDWINFGYEFGMSQPLALDLRVIYIQLQLLFDINIASLLGVIVAIFIYKRL